MAKRRVPRGYPKNDPENPDNRELVREAYLARARTQDLMLDMILSTAAKILTERERNDSLHRARLSGLMSSFIQDIREYNRIPAGPVTAAEIAEERREREWRDLRAERAQESARQLPARDKGAAFPERPPVPVSLRFGSIERMPLLQSFILTSDGKRLDQLKNGLWRSIECVEPLPLHWPKYKIGSREAHFFGEVDGRIYALLAVAMHQEGQYVRLSKEDAERLKGLGLKLHRQHVFDAVDTNIGVTA